MNLLAVKTEKAKNALVFSVLSASSVLVPSLHVKLDCHVKTAMVRGSICGSHYVAMCICSRGEHRNGEASEEMVGGF